MTEPTGPGPYRAPNLEHVTDSDGLKKPGALATFLIVAFTIIAGVVTFFVTCFGVGILSFEVLQGGAILLGIGIHQWFGIITIIAPHGGKISCWKTSALRKITVAKLIAVEVLVIEITIFSIDIIV